MRLKRRLGMVAAFLAAMVFGEAVLPAGAIARRLGPRRRAARAKEPSVTPIVAPPTKS
ncbi:hypothetical protein [Sphingomonas jatrophae]|uniref:Uncharacterized protein n=1 Tax=Sphingomonas jatrophae TaxID=1166337 RepID=A0A1I6L4U6_9SPHN|nr:hypothetical protein [Sphingomonas jatrophae]SFR98503.1 hypothetical protein SAMN05192580_2295 [Sphingomonas jatrophae]